MSQLTVKIFLQLGKYEKCAEYIKMFISHKIVGKQPLKTTCLEQVAFLEQL